MDRPLSDRSGSAEKEALMFYLIAIVAVVLAFLGLFAHDRIQTGRLDSAQAEVTVAQAATRIANSHADDAEAANESLRQDVGKVKAEAQACTAETDKFKRDASAAEDRATLAIADKAKANAVAKIAIDALRSRAKVATVTSGDVKPLSPSETVACREADAIMSALARDVRWALGLTDVVGPTRVEPPK